MKINEIINEKEQLNEFPPAVVAALPVLKTAAAWGLKKIAPKLGWMAKKSYDPSVPDALQKDKVGYGPDQVDPPLAQAARKNYPPKSNPPQVAKRTNVGPMSKLQRATT